MLGRKVFDDRVALIASGLLAMSMPQVWYSKYPTTEVMTQFLIFSAIFTLYKFRETMIPYYGVLPGLCIGQALLTRIDVVTVVATVVLYVIYVGIRHRNLMMQIWFTVPLAVTSLQG